MYDDLAWIGHEITHHHGLLKVIVAHINRTIQCTCYGTHFEGQENEDYCPSILQFNNLLMNVISKKQNARISSLV